MIRGLVNVRQFGIESAAVAFTSTGSASKALMQATLPLRRFTKQHKLVTSELRSSHGPSYSAEELQAFFAARNLILREAEENTTELNLRRAAGANDFAEGRLKAAPSAGPLLPEASCELKRCRAVRMRLAELRLRLRRPAA